MYSDIQRDADREALRGTAQDGGQGHPAGKPGGSREGRPLKVSRHGRGTPRLPSAKASPLGRV